MPQELLLPEDSALLPKVITTDVKERQGSLQSDTLRNNAFCQLILPYRTSKGCITLKKKSSAAFSFFFCEQIGTMRKSKLLVSLGAMNGGTVPHFNKAQ